MHMRGKIAESMQIIHDVRNYANDNYSTLMAGETQKEDMIARFGEDSIWACQLVMHAWRLVQYTSTMSLN